MPLGQFLQIRMLPRTEMQRRTHYHLLNLPLPAKGSRLLRNRPLRPQTLRPR